MSDERPFVYTELESHRASLRERVRVLRLMWRVANEPDLTAKQRRGIKRIALAAYIRPRARVASYIASGGRLRG